MSVDTRSLPLGSSRALPAVLVDIILIVVFGGLVAAAKGFIKTDLGISGSSGLYWIGILLGGRLLVKRDGAGLGLGVTTALWGIPFGFTNTFTHNLAMYALAGGSMDLMFRLPLLNVYHPLGAALCGAVAHLAKLAFITYVGMSMGLYRHFLEVGLLTSALQHILFGAISGCAAAIAFGTARRTIQHRRRKAQSQ